MHLFTDIIHNFNHINFTNHIILYTVIALCLFTIGCGSSYSSDIAISETKGTENCVFTTDTDNSCKVNGIDTDEYTTSIDESDVNMTNNTSSDLSEHLTNDAEALNTADDNYFPENSTPDNSFNEEAAYDYESSSIDFDSPADDSDSSSNDYDSSTDDSDSEPGNSNPNAWIINL